MLEFNFEEIGINLPDYNGMSIQAITAIITDKAAEHYQLVYGFEDVPDYVVFYHYDWNINLVTRTVQIPNNAFVIMPLFH